jgi:3'-phosphoadenosine 5'-phosphosulfate (PAPS) 3'-phosphatase
VCFTPGDSTTRTFGKCGACTGNPYQLQPDIYVLCCGGAAQAKKKLPLAAICGSAWLYCNLWLCAELGGSSGGSTGRHWVLDPIDGTRGFVGMRQYAVCLGMLQDGEVMLGVLGCPNLPQGQVQDEDGGAGAHNMRQGYDTTLCKVQGLGHYREST